MKRVEGGERMQMPRSSSHHLLKSCKQEAEKILDSSRSVVSWLVRGKKRLLFCFNIHDGGKKNKQKPCSGSANEITPHFSANTASTRRNLPSGKLLSLSKTNNGVQITRLCKICKICPQKMCIWVMALNAELHTLPLLVSRFFLGSVNMQSRAALEHSQNILFKKKKEKKLE